MLVQYVFGWGLVFWIVLVWHLRWVGGCWVVLFGVVLLDVFGLSGVVLGGWVFGC